MSDYISREAAQDSVQKHFDDGGFDGYTDGQLMMTRIRDIPAADVSPVRHGRWKKQGGGFVKCTACMVLSFNADSPADWKYCPNCGARMDGGQDE